MTDDVRQYCHIQLTSKPDKQKVVSGKYTKARQTTWCLSRNTDGDYVSMHLHGKSEAPIHSFKFPEISSERTREIGSHIFQLKLPSFCE